MSNPVTRETVKGGIYLSELSRQISGQLSPIVEKSAAKILPLIDAYCLVNRARGSALLAPADMREACLLFPVLKISR